MMVSDRGKENNRGREVRTMAQEITRQMELQVMDQQLEW